MASGGAKVMRGAVVGTGAAIEVKTVGFRPRSVKVLNADSDDELYWHQYMADGVGYKRLKAGGGAMIASPGGVTPLAAGFELGTDGDINVDGETVLWEAFE